MAKRTQHQLQRTAASPLTGGLNLPAKAQSIMRVSPVPPLPLSQTVGRLKVSLGAYD